MAIVTLTDAGPATAATGSVEVYWDINLADGWEIYPGRSWLILFASRPWEGQWRSMTLWRTDQAGRQTRVTNVIDTSGVVFRAFEARLVLHRTGDDSVLHSECASFQPTAPALIEVPDDNPGSNTPLYYEPCKPLERLPSGHILGIEVDWNEQARIGRIFHPPPPPPEE